MDNDDGKIDELQKHVGSNSIIRPLFNIASFVESLATQQILSIYNYEKIANYINLQKTTYIKNLELDDPVEKKLDEKSIHDEYPPLLQNILRAAILTLMMEKKTALCLSLDSSSWNESKQIINACGEYICMVKTRVSQYNDVNNIGDFQKEICELAAKYKIGDSQSYRVFLQENAKSLILHNKKALNMYVCSPRKDAVYEPLNKKNFIGYDVNGLKNYSKF
jgi:hypothetical protein